MKLSKFMAFLMMGAAVSFTACGDDDDDDPTPEPGEEQTPGDKDDDGEEQKPGDKDDDGEEQKPPRPSTSVDYSKIESLSGSDYYVVYMNEDAIQFLGDKVKANLMENLYIDIWPQGESLVGGEPVGNNFFGAAEGWTAFVVNQWAEGWNGGGQGTLCANINKLKAVYEAVQEDGEDYYFHIAVKTNNSKAAQTLFFYGANNTETKVCYNGNVNGAIKIEGEFSGDGEWAEIEFPVSKLFDAGIVWDGTMPEGTEAEPAKKYVLGFQTEHVVGATFEYDAAFIYKK